MEGPQRARSPGTSQARRRYRAIAGLALVAALGVAAILWRPFASDEAPKAPPSPVAREDVTAPELLPGVPLPDDAPPRANEPDTDPDEARSDDFDLEEAFEEAPDDPAQTGPGSVHVRFVDGATREAAEATTQLWRLGAPGNADWGPGDQLQAVQHVPDLGRVFADLPLGRYRLHVIGARRDAKTDPPAFEVGALRKHHVFEIEVAQFRSPRLQVFDEFGDRIRRGMFDLASRVVESRRDAVPDWRTARALKRQDTYIVDVDYEDEYLLRAPKAFEESDDGGFHVHPVVAPTRGGSQRVHSRFGFEGRTSISMRSAFEPDDSHVYRAVSLRRAPIEDAVRMRDGERAVDVGAELTATCQARRVARGTRFDGRKFPIEVRVRLEGYKELTFTFRPGDTLARRVLEPAD